MAAGDAEEYATLAKNIRLRMQRATKAKENICMGGAYFVQ